MEYRCKVTVIEKKLFPELQAQYCAVPDSGKCPCFHVGDEFIFYRNDERDDYWHMGTGTLIKSGEPDEGCLQSPGTMHCGAEGVPFCSEDWDAISRYIYTALQGGAIMHGWTNDDRVMITCCNDGIRPVIFKIERIDVENNDSDRLFCGKKFFFIEAGSGDYELLGNMTVISVRIPEEMVGKSSDNYVSEDEKD